MQKNLNGQRKKDMSWYNGGDIPRLMGPPGFSSSSNGIEKHKEPGGLPPNSAAVQEASVNECFVCCREIELFAVGVCDHPVCHVCSTRLRILCGTNECPGCRAIMEKVFFVTKCLPFESLKEKKFSLEEKKFGIVFENDEVFASYNELLANKCKECVRRGLISERSGERSHPPKTYESFEALEKHVEHDHRRYFCKLCVEHLKLFTSERQVYSKADLHRHLKEGDYDDTSYKGHPRCDFCKVHYLDKDELYKHLKVDHFSCFICQRGNASNRLLQYYANYNTLRNHFMSAHFLCEQGECEVKRFVAFASKLEHKYHTATSHSESMSREEQRAARDLGADFAIASSARESYRVDGESTTVCRSHRDNVGGRHGSGRERVRHDSPPESEMAQDEWYQSTVDTTSIKDFPCLLGDSPVTKPLIPTPQYGIRMTTLMNSAEEFPSLGRPTDPIPSSSLKWLKATKEGAMSSAVRSMSNGAAASASAQTSSKPRPQPKSQSDLFPTLPKSDCESDFGKVLKPIPTRKQQDGGQLPAAKEKRPLIKPNPGEVYKTTSAKNDHQQKTTDGDDIKVVTKTSKGASGLRRAENPVREEPESFAEVNTENTFETLDGLDSKSGFLPKDSASTNSEQRTSCANQDHSARPKLPKEEDFPSLGASYAAVCSADLKPIRSKYNGIKPGLLGQENRSNNQFIQPPSFNRRTTEFMGMLKLLLNGDPERITGYRLSMTNFRKGIISGEEFVYSCMQLFDDCSEFTKIFVELVCLMPDIAKQNDLIELYDNLKSEYGPQRKGNVRDWIRCPECGQITIPKDVQFHQKAH